MNEERLRELERAATYVTTNERRRCRCGGSCPRCRPWDEAKAKLTPAAILELVATLRNERTGRRDALWLYRREHGIWTFRIGSRAAEWSIQVTDEYLEEFGKPVTEAEARGLAEARWYVLLQTGWNPVAGHSDPPKPV